MWIVQIPFSGKVTCDDLCLHLAICNLRLLVASTFHLPRPAAVMVVVGSSGRLVVWSLKTWIPQRVLEVPAKNIVIKEALRLENGR